MAEALDASKLSEELISSKEKVVELTQKVLNLLKDKDELQTKVANLEEELLNQAKGARAELEKPVRHSVSAGGAIGAKKGEYSLVQLMQEGLKRKLL